MNNVSNNIRDNPLKNLWRLVNEKRESNTVVSNHKCILAINLQIMPKILLTCLLSILLLFNNANKCTRPETQTCFKTTVSLEKINISEIYEGICHLSNSLSIGPDKIPNYFFEGVLIHNFKTITNFV